jgi:hypothetical protein
MTRSDDDNLRLRCAELGAELEEAKLELANALCRAEGAELDLREMTKQCERALLRAGESAEKAARMDAKLRQFCSTVRDADHFLSRYQSLIVASHADRRETLHNVCEEMRTLGLWRDAPQPQEKAL